MTHRWSAPMRALYPPYNPQRIGALDWRAPAPFRAILKNEGIGAHWRRVEKLLIA